MKENKKIKEAPTHKETSQNSNEQVDYNKNLEKINDLEKEKVSYSEVNLLKYPFFVLNPKERPKKNKIIFNQAMQYNNEKVEIEWKVVGHPEYGGLPGPFDKEVHRAIERIIIKILKKKKYVENPIRISSYYEILQEIGLPASGKFYYDGIKKALMKIKTTTIESKRAFYIKKENRWINKEKDETGFSLYSRYILKGDERDDGTISDAIYIYLDEIYLSNFNNFYIKALDENYLKSLKNNIAQRLYEILGLEFYKAEKYSKDYVRIKYATLVQLLPAKREKYLSKAKQQLDPSHEELKNSGFILNYTWSGDSDDWIIYYVPGPRAKKEKEMFKIAEKDDMPLALMNGEDNPLLDKLEGLNISKTVAEDLIKNYDIKLIENWLEAINFIDDIEDKAAYFIKAIKEGWNVPEKAVRKKEGEKRKERYVTETEKYKERIEKLLDAVVSYEDIQEGRIYSIRITENCELQVEYMLDDTLYIRRYKEIEKALKSFEEQRN